MSVKSSSSTGEAAVGEVVRVGYLRKLKTMRKKFFVLRAESLETSARLEYYDSEKKFRSSQPPKRCISLKACFNINKRVDTKHKNVIALFTKDDCFCVVLESERDLEDWLKSLLSLQHGEDFVDGETPKPMFEHVWQVTMLNKGLGSTRNILGAYHLCFTDKTLSLVRKSTTIVGNVVTTLLGAGGGTGHMDHVEFSLMSIRRCGHTECFFYMEVGRSAVTGAGELWMQTEDPNIAHNMGETILRAMSNNNKEDLAPKQRNRSSSANEASKPILVQRRQTHSGGQKSTSYCSPSQDGAASKSGEQVVSHPECAIVGYSNISTPSTHHTGTAMSGFVIFQPHIHQRPVPRPSQRRHSVSAGGTITWSGMAHHQRTQSLPLTPHVTHAHVDNNNPCYLPRTTNTKRANNNSSSSRCMGGRERCDSMPSRARTSSEGNPPMTVTHPMRSHLAPHRPQSFYGREISHSPPAGSPVSPASVACSGSSGSSLSIDEQDAWPDYTDTTIGRYGLSLTPDEPIAEENCDEGTDNPYVPVSPTSGSPINGGGYVPMAPLSSDDGYVDMSPRGRHTDMSPAASSCSITSGTPSTDMRFSEYHLEKVSSYFTPSEEDDTSSAERPLRAYSVGSRPEAMKAKSKLEAMLGNHENSRVRAFSVGSRVKGIHNRVLPPHGHPPCTGGKSSSAPLLSGPHGHSGSHSSMERMDDLMEMDFSKPMQQKAGYVDMSPRNRSVPPPGYVEMKPGISDYTPTTPDLPYMDMRPAASPVGPSSSAHLEPAKEQHPYVDMRPAPATSPLKPASVPLPGSSVGSRDSGYMDMRPSTSPHKPSSIPKYNPYYVEMSGSSKLGTSPKNNKAASPIQEEYMDMNFKATRNTRTDRTVSGAARTQPVDLPHPKKASDGYMDMSWSRHQRKSSLESAKVNANNNDDYMVMTSGSSRKKERRGSKKEKSRSQPITIQSAAPTKVVSAQSPVNSFTSFLQNTTSARKSSTGTPPKHPPNYLPLNSISYSPGNSPFSSLRRQRKTSSRRDSKDSSGLVTPTSESSTIFPFSPGSPIKHFAQVKTPDPVATRKCAVDASSGTVKLPDSANKPPQSGSDYARMSFDFSNKVSSDYTEMNFENVRAPNRAQLDKAKRSNDSDFDRVNYWPAVPKQRNISDSSDGYGEYAVMRPISIVPTAVNANSNSVRQMSAPSVSSNSTITKQLSSLTVNNVKPCVFKPIVEPKEDNRLGAVSPRPGDVAPHRSFENLRTDQESSSGVLDATTSRSECADRHYETLRSGNYISPVARIPRPDSVNSEKISRPNSRPGSVASDRSASRPSSVSSEVTKATLSRPSSVSSELGSTSSTVVGGSRPASVNADLIVRPSSVTSESRELHYASLDLAPADEDGTRSPRNVRVPETARSPTPNSASGGEPVFTYAEIDFIKSEEMRHNNVTATAVAVAAAVNNNNNNMKVKH